MNYAKTFLLFQFLQTYLVLLAFIKQAWPTMKFVNILS